MIVSCWQKRMGQAQSRVNAMVGPLKAFIQERDIVMQRCMTVDKEHEEALSAVQNRVRTLEASVADTQKQLTHSHARGEGND